MVEAQTRENWFIRLIRRVFNRPPTPTTYRWILEGEPYRLITASMVEYDSLVEAFKAMEQRIKLSPGEVETATLFETTWPAQRQWYYRVVDGQLQHVHVSDFYADDFQNLALGLIVLPLLTAFAIIRWFV